MAKKKQKVKINWMLVAVLALLLVVPSSIFIKLTSNEVNPYLVTMLRYGIVVITLLPFMIKAFLKNRKLIIKSLPIIIIMTMITCVGGPLHAAAIAGSSASFIEVLNLSYPIIFSIISILVTRDKLSKYSAAGLLMAILGGVVIILLPIILGSGTILTFGWLPVALQGITIVLGAISIVYLRKMNERGIPLTFLLGMGFIAAFIASIPLAMMDGGTSVFSQIGNLSVEAWAMIVYMAVIISVVAHMIKIKAYENIGTASYASLDYFYYALAITLPVFILGEVLSWEVIVGAVLIIIGIIFTRMHHKKTKYRHHLPIRGHR